MEETRRQGEVMPRLSPKEEINQMDEGQLLSKKEQLEGYFNDCRAIEQGIGSKEHVWYNLVCDRLESEFGHEIERWH